MKTANLPRISQLVFVVFLVSISCLPQVTSEPNKTRRKSATRLGHSDFLRDCLPPPPAHDDLARFFKLKPRTFYGVVEEFDIRELVPGLGEYSMVVHYLSGLSRDWVSEYGGDKMAALPIWRFGLEMTQNCPAIVST